MGFIEDGWSGRWVGGIIFYLEEVEVKRWGNGVWTLFRIIISGEFWLKVNSLLGDGRYLIGKVSFVLGLWFY